MEIGRPCRDIIECIPYLFGSRLCQSTNGNHVNDARDCSLHKRQQRQLEVHVRDSPCVCNRDKCEKFQQKRSTSLSLTRQLASATTAKMDHRPSRQKENKIPFQLAVMRRDADSFCLVMTCWDPDNMRSLLQSATVHQLDLSSMRGKHLFPTGLNLFPVLLLFFASSV